MMRVFVWRLTVRGCASRRVAGGAWFSSESAGGAGPGASGGAARGRQGRARGPTGEQAPGGGGVGTEGASGQSGLGNTEGAARGSPTVGAAGHPRQRGSLDTTSQTQQTQTCQLQTHANKIDMKL